jgi:hypothetical protein
MNEIKIVRMGVYMCVSEIVCKCKSTLLVCGGHVVLIL